MSRILEHAEQELKYAGMNISEEGCNPKNPKDPMDGYVNACAQNAMELLKVFVKAGHSGMSAEVTLNIFNKLARQENLTPLTNNPEEWMQVSFNDKDISYQSKRNCSCFSDDGLKTYHNLNEPKPRKNYPLEDYKKCILK